jgi:hypothetical protein
MDKVIKWGEALSEEMLEILQDGGSICTLWKTGKPYSILTLDCQGNICSKIVNTHIELLRKAIRVLAKRTLMLHQYAFRLEKRLSIPYDFVVHEMDKYLDDRRSKLRSLRIPCDR